MIEYVILGTSHPDKQDSPKFGKPVAEAIQKHCIRLVAEEHPLDTISVAWGATKHLHVPYLQVDPFPEELAKLGIQEEITLRNQCFQGQDVRIRQADDVREVFWLEMIEASLDHGRVLVICGYLHVDFLAEKVKKRGGRVVETNFFPPEYLGRKPERILDQAELEDLKRKGHGPKP